MNNRRRMKNKTIPYTFSDKQVWNASTTMATFNLCLLKEFKKREKNTFPGFDEADTSEKWDDLIDRFIYTFDQLVHEYPGSPINMALNKMHREHPETTEYTLIDNPDGTCTMKWKHEDIIKQYLNKDTKKKEIEYRNYIQEGLQLFGKFFESIWD